jgi:O-6-methylguanine DNA methyltransferase
MKMNRAPFLSSLSMCLRSVFRDFLAMFTEFLTTPIGILAIHAEPKLIVAIQLLKEEPFPSESNQITKECKKQLEEYFKGTRRSFELPLKIDGTEFQKAVWHELLHIHYGADIAINVGRPKAQRAVGTANRMNSLPIIIPCHRVIGKDGKLVGYGLGNERKKWLLQHECSIG